MTSDFLFIALAGLRFSLPLIIAAWAGYFSEKSGIAMVGLEGFMLIGAFSGATLSFYFNPEMQTLNFFQSFTIVLASGAIAACFSILFFIFNQLFKVNAIIVGTALNLLVFGLIPQLGKAMFDSTGSTPSTVSIQSIDLILIVVIVFLFFFYLVRWSTWGLRHLFAGEKASALGSIGISLLKVRFQSLLICGFLAGISGAVLSTYLSSSYSPMMTAGRGFIALAALIFSGWNFYRVILVAYVFGLFEALQIFLQTQEQFKYLIPSEFFQMLPYIGTLIALFWIKKKSSSPEELSQN